MLNGETYARASEHGLLSSGVKNADGVIKAAPGKVYWVTISPAGGARLNDSIDNSGTDLWQIAIPNDGYAHIIFDPPLEFEKGIWLDVPAGTPNVIVGYI